MMNLQTISSRSLFLIVALSVNILIFIGIPQLSGRQAHQRTGERFDPVFLSDFRPPPPPPPRQQIRKSEPRTVKPKQIPKVSVKPKQVTSHRPRMQLETPQVRFEINPLLKTGLAIAPPPVEPAPEKVVEAPPSPLESIPSEFGVGDVDQVPEIVKKVEPMYPYRARRRNIHGEVVVRFLVSAAGHVERPSIVEARPGGVFEKSVLQAVRRWRFKPGYFKGKPVPTWVVLPIRFNLNG